MGGFFLAPAEGKRGGRLQQKGPSGPNAILPDERMDGRTDGRMNRQTDGRTDGRRMADGWQTDGRRTADGRTNRQTDEQTD